MNEPIKRGDPVMLVWGCCSYTRRYIGWTGDVLDVGPATTSCEWCRGELNGVHAKIHVTRFGMVPISWVKKMPPAAKPDQVEDVEEAITA